MSWPAHRVLGKRARAPSARRLCGEFEKATGLPKRQREEIEQFFVSATYFTGKDPKIEGWRGPKAALAIVKHAI